MPLPEMQPVESSAVARIGYDAELEEAFVEYLDGDLYAYEGVPVDIFEELRHAESKGTFVNATIKRYPFRRVADALSSAAGNRRHGRQAGRPRRFRGRAPRR